MSTKQRLKQEQQGSVERHY